MKSRKEEKEITITNIWLASYLLYEGEHLFQTAFEGEKIVFVFQNSFSLQEKISSFLTDEAVVHPQKFISFYQFLKNLIYEKKGKEKWEEEKRRK